ncbi:catalase family peroxidase [Paenibacillus endoradicis]|uniref:catalase family peroxidase n=1 Tax=Paenibacillus endoradicis TaxID=2972487 RepID=UPI00215983B3|nr:catalase family peroxidase [Paenibacillus endoradicis]MCR8658649.1 catalase family peroxidase [Paenibacillus endoradicis]
MTTSNPDHDHSKHITVSSSIASQTVDAIENISGVHSGYRRAHAKGICCQAVFRPSGLAAPFTSAPHLQEQEVNAIARFSGSSTDPLVADFMSPAKGMAVQFMLPGGDVTNLVGATIPVFFARTPESFLDMIRAVHRAQEGTLGPLDLLQEITSHFSESKESLLAVKKLMPPSSYAECQYYCIHVYFFNDREGNSYPVKFEWIPATGVHTLSIIEAAQQPDDYLEEELNQRLKFEPIVFHLHAIFGEKGDPTDDPTTAWPEDRRRIDLGQLYISDIIKEPVDLLMDPTIITEGMALSNDPILNFRHTTYAVSHDRRHQER